MIGSLVSLFNRDIDRLKAEISAFDGKSLWVIEGEINNSAGNLAIHLCGNLQHFIGATLGNSGYIRDRKHEFQTKDLPLDTLLDEIELTKSVVNTTLKELNTQSLNEAYPIEVFGKPMTKEYFLIHLHSHLNYHLGQINYLRRLIG